MSNKSERKLRRHIMERRVRIAAILGSLLLVFVTGGGFVYGKYYAQNYQKGIAIASGVYFTANYAVAVEGETEDYFESLVSTRYQGVDYSFEFEVRNYENNLLFNESTVVIPYSLSFWLEDEPIGASYTVQYHGESIAITTDKTNKATFSLHSIAGGQAIANQYTIAVDVAEDVVHTPIPVYVEVRTSEDAVISTTLRGKMVLNTSQGSENYIESQQFVVPTEVADDVEKFEEVKRMSMLTYEIRTVGEVFTGGEVTERLKLSWDPKVLEIDLFDDAYREWLNSGKTAPAVDTNGWNYITIEVLPYSAATVGFFRGDSFEDETVVNSMDTLHSFIKAEKYQESSEVEVTE